MRQRAVLDNDVDEAHNHIIRLAPPLRSVTVLQRPGAMRRRLSPLCKWLVAGLLWSASQGAIASGDVLALMRDALQQHPSLRVQAGAHEAALAGVESAKWQFWPTPSLNMERVDASDPNYLGDSTVTTLRLQQPLWTGGRLTGTLSKAEAQAIVTQAEVEATRQQLALRVLQSWSNAMAAQGKVIAYEQSRNVHARLLAMVERRAGEGVSARADIHLARSRLDGIDADLASAVAQRDTALSALQLLVGHRIAIDDIATASRTAPPRHNAALASLLAASRDQSPLLAKARAQAKIAEADIDVAKAALSPEVYLRAERQYGDFSLPDQDPQNRVFIGVTTTFGGGLSTFSGIDAARAQHRAYLADIQSQQLVVDEQVQGDLTLSQSAAGRRASLERARQTADDVSASWERQFLAGRKQWQDLMNAAREQTQIDVQLADAIATDHLTGWRLAILSRGVDATLQLTAQPLAHQTAPEAAVTRVDAEAPL